MSESQHIVRGAVAADRRRGADRRTRVWHALLTGNVNPRRLGPRRARDGSFASTDWHEPRWLVVALLIMLCSCCDALLTVVLIEHGAYEANPLMAAVLGQNVTHFAAVKIGLTAMGVIFLTILARVRAFGRIPVGAILYAVLAAYVGLVAYELWLLRALTSA